ncbi:hypothetical protein BU25DRAFT_4155 [Macroventuria anomochaeta]|uniref:Uncharacterized protein n=1 Tax=Macroventuria anomochaeta TaxID=301207 RepID=A0ACB6SIK3_9PLEO|nr:uncharacterized protein BU25DRAFT_4155 [Macroventuria anomochaeta]KAF2633342.1 hypothetical protein BU25DRAFT_4155 [Macroventuria anomochaeta]
MQTTPPSHTHKRADSLLSSPGVVSKTEVLTLPNCNPDPTGEVPTAEQVSSLKPGGPHQYSSTLPADKVDSRHLDLCTAVLPINCVPEPADCDFLEGVGVGGSVYTLPAPSFPFCKAHLAIRSRIERRRREREYERKKAVAEKGEQMGSEVERRSEDPSSEYLGRATDQWMIFPEEVEGYAVEKEIYKGYGLLSKGMEMGNPRRGAERRNREKLEW